MNPLRADRARPYARWHTLSPEEKVADRAASRLASVNSLLLGWRALDVPGTGYWLMRMVKLGPEVPASIQWETTEHEPGNPDNVMDRSPILTARINGDIVAWDRVWNWTKREITESEFHFRTADAAWARTNAPNEPAANPTRRLDLMQVPAPF